MGRTVEPGAPGGSRRAAAVLVALIPALLAGAPPAAADCTCRAGGRDYQLGATVCLRGPGGARLARCDMALNNTSWTPLPTPCPLAGSAGPASIALALAHAHAALHEDAIDER